MTTITAPAPAPARAELRLARLADRAAALRLRRGGSGRDDRWLLLVGGTAMPLGLVLILLGWYGSAQTVLPFEQTPYLISGGLLGLALVIGGGLLYFAYWLTLMVREGRAERERVAAHQERLERALVELVARLGGVQDAADDTRVVTTPSGTQLHRPSCVATRGLEVVEVAYDDGTLELCALCRPEPPPPVPVVAEPRRRAPRSARTAQAAR